MTTGCARGARGLLHVWYDSAAAAVLEGPADEHHRPAEMCSRVATAHEVAGTAAGAARLVDHDMARVRVQLVRCSAVNGDVEHAALVERLLADEDVAVWRHAQRALAAMGERLDLPGVERRPRGHRWRER